MQVSARILGQDYDMTAEEMNRALQKRGFLEGTPGDYYPTTEGFKYAVEKDWHRGTGGYAQYNRYWTTRTYDDSIKDVLNITPELKCEIRQELAEARAARQAQLAAERAEADAEFRVKMVEEEAAKKAAADAEADAIRRAENLKKVGKITLIVAGVAAVGYGIYKAVPKVKEWWAERKEKKQAEQEAEEELSRPVVDVAQKWSSHMNQNTRAEHCEGRFSLPRTNLPGCTSFEPPYVIKSYHQKKRGICHGKDVGHAGSG